MRTSLGLWPNQPAASHSRRIRRLIFGIRNGSRGSDVVRIAVDPAHSVAREGPGSVRARSLRPL